jgi:hypothetical protein
MTDDSPCAEVHELDTDHSPFLTATSRLARLLDQIARRPPTDEAAPGR